MLELVLPFFTLTERTRPRKSSGPTSMAFTSVAVNVRLQSMIETPHDLLAYSAVLVQPALMTRWF